jgi:threonine synthase
VALLNSKNAWRILGQESYAYEIAQDLGYDLGETVVVVPIGNAGNITAVMNGFLKFWSAGIIERLPKIIGVQSDHANPVYRYYRQEPSRRGSFQPVSVKPSVAQAAMIGNPVSMPRVMHLVRHYDELAGSQHVFFASVSEQDIMDCQLLANRNGNVVCTHGGECLAGLLAARERGWVGAGETAVLDSTAHALKFSGFQTMYFEKRIPPEYEIVPNPNRINLPTLVRPDRVQRYPEPGKPLGPADLESFVEAVADEIAKDLDLQAR